MGAKQSQEMKNAINKVATGVPVYKAAKECDVLPSSLYQALAKEPWWSPRPYGTGRKRSIYRRG